MSDRPGLRPIWIVAAIVIALAAWMASGLIGNADGSRPSTGAATVDRSGDDMSRRVPVTVRRSTAESVWREVELNGESAPDRAVTLRAQTAGRIDAVPAERGSRVESGAVIARLNVAERRANRREAEAIVEQRRLQYEAVRDMSNQGYQTRTDLAQARANLEAAHARLAEIEEDIANTVIRAPFDGVLETRPVEVGDYAGIGDEIARVIQTDPLVVTADLAEKDVAFLEPGQSGRARLVGGREVEGHVRFVASEAQPSTRTYPVELEVDNPEGRLISGASAKLILPLEQVDAHEIPTDLLSLSEAGDMGIKTVEADGTVAFRSAEIARSGDGRLWLTGLPETIRLITRGQGFVRAGDTVRIVDDPAAAAGRDARTGNAAPDDAQ